MADFANLNLCGASTELNNVLLKLEDARANIIANLNEDAAAATAAFAEKKNELVGLVNELQTIEIPTLPVLNLQAEVKNLTSLVPGSPVFLSTLAKIKSEFGDDLTDIGLELDDLVESAVASLPSGAATIDSTELDNVVQSAIGSLSSGVSFNASNLQSQITNLTSYEQGSSQYTSALAKIKSEFEDDLTASGLKLDNLVESALGILSSAAIEIEEAIDICANIPNLEKETGSSKAAVEKATAVLQASTSSTIETVSETVENVNVDANFVVNRNNKLDYSVSTTPLENNTGAFRIAQGNERLSTSSSAGAEQNAILPGTGTNVTPTISTGFLHKRITMWERFKLSDIQISTSSLKFTLKHPSIKINYIKVCPSEQEVATFFRDTELLENSTKYPKDILRSQWYRERAPYYDNSDGPHMVRSIPDLGNITITGNELEIKIPPTFTIREHPGNIASIPALEAVEQADGNFLLVEMPGKFRKKFRRIGDDSKLNKRYGGFAAEISYEYLDNYDADPKSNPINPTVTEIAPAAPVTRKKNNLGPIENTIEEEGGYQADPTDLGNYTKENRQGKLLGTNMGITPREWAKYKRVGVDTLTADDIKNITHDEAVGFYQDRFNRFGVDKYPVEVQYQIFDMTTLHGGWRNIVRDAKARSGGVTNNNLVEARLEYFDALINRKPELVRFKNGWYARAKRFRDDGTSSTSSVAVASSSGAATSTYQSTPALAAPVQAERLPPKGIGTVAFTKITIRKLPLQPELMNIIQTAAAKTGLHVIIHSAGQPASGVNGRDRLGSKRHNDGFAADIWLYTPEVYTSNLGKNRLSVVSDIKLVSDFSRALKAAGIISIGAGPGYMNNFGIHIDIAPGNSVSKNAKTFWGAGGSVNTAPTWLKNIMV